MLELWKAVRRYVEKRAWGRARAPGCRAEAEDLIQVGFLAVIETAERFEPGRGYGFIHALNYTLKKAFAAEDGIRTTKRDALQYAKGIDEAAFREDPDGLTVEEITPDDGAALAFMGVEYEDFMTYCRGMIGAALDTLTDAQAALLRLHYLEGRSLEAAAPLCGLSGEQAASEAKYRALSRLEHGRYCRELRECLAAFDDFRAYGEAAQWDTWSRTGISRTEAAAIVKSGGIRE